MARTALFRSLQRALALARVAGQRGWSVDRALECEAASRRLRDRRAFLQRTAAAAASLAAVSCRTRLPPRSAAAEVVVIGAGIAGLTCAYRLQRAGVRVRVIEAQERIGGRIFSLRGHFADGQVAELGGELIDSGHARMRALAAELGLSLDDYQRDAPELARSRWYFGGQLRSEREVIEGFLPLAAAIERDRRAVGDQPIDRHSPAPVVALDRLSLAAWLDRNGASGWFRSLLEVAYTTEMGLSPDRQSALNLITFIDTRPDPFRVFGDSDERFHVRGGNDALTTELGRRLTAVIEPATVLESVRRTAGGDFKLSLRCAASAREIAATHLVLALPLTTLRRVELAIDLPAPLMRAVHSVAYGTNAKLMVGFARRAWREAGSDGSTFSDLPYQTSWDSSRLQPGAAGILTSFVGGAEGVELGRGSASERAARAVGQLERVFPGLSGLREGMPEARFHWPTHPWTLGSYACPGPGDWTAYGGVFSEVVARVRFAGEHCSSEAQGFMEGGCESGERAAAQLLAELGVGRQHVLRTRRELFRRAVAASEDRPASAPAAIAASPPRLRAARRNSGYKLG